VSTEKRSAIHSPWFPAVRLSYMRPACRWLGFLSGAIATLTTVLTVVLAPAMASAAGPLAGKPVGASYPEMILAAGHQLLFPRPGSVRRVPAASVRGGCACCRRRRRRSDRRGSVRLREQDGPRAPRPVQDFKVSSPEDTVGPYSPSSPTDVSRGASTFIDPKVAGLSGQYHVLPAGTELLPDGLAIHCGWRGCRRAAAVGAQDDLPDGAHERF
jgi:hypothetical protein